VVADSVWPQDWPLPRPGSEVAARIELLLRNPRRLGGYLQERTALTTELDKALEQLFATPLDFRAVKQAAAIRTTQRAATGRLAGIRPGI
jgi:hypothetical protein